MRIGISKSETMILSCKQSRVWDMLLSQVEKLKYLGVFLMNEGRVGHETDKLVGVVLSVMWTLYQSVMGKRELSIKAKLSTCWSIYVLPSVVVMSSR